MDNRNATIFSQSYFVSGKTKNSNLSLTCKRKNQLKGPVEKLTLSKQTESPDNSENGSASGEFSRSNSTEMEKFLERFKNTKQAGRASLHRKVKQSGTLLDKGRSIHGHGGEPKESPEGEISDFKDSHLPSSNIVSKKAIYGQEFETVKGSSGPSSSDNHIELENRITDGASASKESDQCAEKPVNSDLLQSETNESNIFLCPLCWKPFDCKDAQFTHMKACATKHNVSTKQLLELLELIQRQEDERKALGLPFLPCKIPKIVKKESVVSSIRPKNALDGNIQLGIALSVSLKEAELEKERDHLLEAGLFDEAKEKGLLPDQEVVEDHPLPTAPIFLSVGRKGSNTGIGLPKTRKKNKFGQGGRVPTLLKRTSEDREKLITEKVAIILVGDEQFNSTLSIGHNKSTWDIKSKRLRKYLDEEQIWWRMASLSPSSSSRDQFYVNCLSNFISPCKVAVGSKLKHLSQIPGRNNSPEKAPSVELHGCVENGEMEISLLASPSSDVKLDPNLYSKKKEVKRNIFAESTQCTVQSTLSRDWNMLVGNHEMSDVTVYTQEDRKIPAHKLVFFSRCPAILQELVEEETKGKKRCMLLWVETCYSAALTFLKYIYADVFNGADVTSKVTLEHLNSLAERYEVRDLLEVLEKVHSSREENENSMHISLGKVNENISIGRYNSSAFVNDGEDGSNQGETSFKTTGSDVAMNEKDKTSSVPTTTTVSNEEKGSFLCDENHGSSPRILEQNDSCQVETDFNVSATRINSPSVSPILSNFGRSSPDIFQVTKMMDSPGSVEILEDKPKNSEALASTEQSSQETRESIEYLVRLMEKDSLHKSAEDDPKDPDNVTSLNYKDNKLEQMSENSHISESPSLVKTNRSFDDFIDIMTPKIPYLRKQAEELIISSTPLVQGTTVLKKSGTIVTKDEIMVSNEVKRKLQNLDKSDPASPNPKKICVGVDKDGKVMESGEREVVDLTLSGSESEEVAEEVPLNNSNCSTLPPPVCDLPTFSPPKDAEAPSPSAASPCGTYISNVWDDFDCISYLHHVDFDEPIFASQKSFIHKEDKGICSATNVNGNEKNVTDESIVVGSPKVDDSSDLTILVCEKETEKAIFSPIKSVQVSPEKEMDITEKLLSNSLNKINESLFWRDENEPREEAEKSNLSVSSHTPVRTCLKAASSKNDTPRTPVHLKQPNVTPLADYSAMKTPVLHKELDRYGIKHLKRNQAKQLLRHIYNELHPVVTAEAECSSKSSNDVTLKEKEILSIDEKRSSKENKAITKKKISFESLDSSSGEVSSSEEGSDSNSDSVILEESMYEPQFESPVKNQTLTQKGAYIDIPTAMKKLIESDTAFHRKILLYEPVWLNDIKVALKANGAKFNANQLMDYLDEQCITFRIAQGNRHQRRKKASKKAFSLSQPCNQKRKNKETISSSQPG